MMEPFLSEDLRAGNTRSKVTGAGAFLPWARGLRVLPCDGERLAVLGAQEGISPKALPLRSCLQALDGGHVTSIY